MKRTTANLEREEKAIEDAFRSGMKHGFSMREHLNNIRKHRLYEACDCNNFTEYVKAGRLPLEPGHAYKVAANGEVAGYLENSHAREFSDRALTELSKIRVEEDGKRTQQMDAPKIRKVAKKALAMAANVGTGVTSTLVKHAKAEVLAPKEPKPFGEQIEKEITRAGKWMVSIKQLDPDVFLDAEEEYPGSVTRLATAYSNLASLLRKVLK